MRTLHKCNTFENKVKTIQRKGFLSHYVLSNVTSAQNI